MTNTNGRLLRIKDVLRRRVAERHAVLMRRLGAMSDAELASILEGVSPEDREWLASLTDAELVELATNTTVEEIEAEAFLSTENKNP